MKLSFDHLRRLPVLNWLVMIAFLVTLLLPLHLHIHHDEHSGVDQHNHMIDVHSDMYASDNVTSHSEHANALIVDISPDLIAKLFHNLDLAFALILFSLFLLPAMGNALRIRHIREALHFRHFYAYQIPQLRAPPATH